MFLTVSCLIKLAFHLQSDLVAIRELKIIIFFKSQNGKKLVAFVSVSVAISILV